MNSRLVLLAGFGGLLLLMLFAGIDSLQTLQGIQTSNDAVRADFLLRTRVLERIRADLYVSGTYVRDYLLEPESGKAEGHRYSLLEARKDMDAAITRYRTLLTAPERQPFRLLEQELADYWRVLDPVFAWTAAQRKAGGFPFLRDDVFPRRMAILRIADEIRAIDESQLNAGKLRMEAAFSQFRNRLIATIGLTAGLGLLLAAFTMRRILSLEHQGSAHLAEISAARVQLQKLSARLLDAQEEERRSISRELHDEVGQALTGVLVEMANLTRLIHDRDVDAVASKAAAIKGEVEGSIRVVRNMALLLRPSMLDDLGLVPALEWQAREVARRSGVRIEVDAAGAPEDLPDEHRTCVYRIVQEALHNMVRHAGARNVNVTVRREDDGLLLVIRDDGRGFEPHRHRGMGLLGIEERVGHLGGTFVVESQPGQGTVLRVRLPLVGAAA